MKPIKVQLCCTIKPLCTKIVLSVFAAFNVLLLHPSMIGPSPIYNRNKEKWMPRGLPEAGPLSLHTPPAQSLAITADNPGQEHQPPHRWKSHVLLWTTVGPLPPQIQLNRRLKSVFLSAVGHLRLGMRKHCFHLLLVESAHVKPMGRKGQLWIEKDAPARGPAQFQSVLFAGQLCLLCSKLHCPTVGYRGIPTCSGFCCRWEEFVPQQVALAIRTQVRLSQGAELGSHRSSELLRWTPGPSRSLPFCWVRP